jgi:hypothetical protein
MKTDIRKEREHRLLGCYVLHCSNKSDAKLKGFI